MPNQAAKQNGKGPVGSLNRYLYQLPTTGPTAAFNDIVQQHFSSGNAYVTLDSNAQYGSGVPGMNTTSGWDLTTGFGSPNVGNFVHDLVNALPTP